MRVLFLIPHPRAAASGRYRVYQYLPWLERAGIDVDVRPFMSERLYECLYQPGRLAQKMAMSAAALVKRLGDFADCRRANVVVVHREALPLGTALFERLVAQRRPVVFDFDDAIYLTHASYANSWTRPLRRGAKVERIIAASAEVIAGNDILAAYARRFSDSVTIIPTPVDTELYRSGPAREAGGRVTIGWIGSHSTAQYLAPLQEPLQRLARRYPQLEVRLVGAGAAPLSGAHVRSDPWTLAGELAQLRQFDIGIMPMPEDEWARGKCGFKALLYMSIGIPVVASPVGITQQIVAHETSGFIARDAAEWHDSLNRLIDDSHLRRRMGEAGRAIVEQRYAVCVHAPRFLDVVQRAAETPHRSRSLAPIADAPSGAYTSTCATDRR